MHIGLTYQSCIYSDVPYTKALVDRWFINQKRAYQLNLNSFVNYYGEYSAEKILDELFPTPDIDIFISHSHDDFEEAKFLAYHLSTKFGQKVFLDEYVWGSANDLLEKINENFYDNKTDTYDLEKSCLNASSVYILLANAISKVIHNCETFIFMESSNSINVLTPGCTASPWIYFELQLINDIITNENQLRHEQEIIKLAAEGMMQPIIAFPANYKSFIKFSILDLREMVAKELNAREDYSSDGLMQRLNQYLNKKNKKHE